MREYSIAIVGGVGVGKSTLVEGLAKRELRRVISEPWQENQYITQLPQNAFSCQWKQAKLTLKAHRELKQFRHSILDRTYFEVFDVFTRQLRGSLTAEEFEALQQENRRVEPTVYVPDIILYIEVQPGIAWNRIVERGRAFEVEGYSLDYCDDQAFLYGGLVAKLSKKTHVAKIDGSKTKDQVLAQAQRRLRAFERTLKS